MTNHLKVIYWCRLMETLLLVGLVAIPVLGQLITWLSVVGETSAAGGILAYEKCETYVGNYPNTLTVAISTLLEDMIISWMLWQFYSIFKSIRTGDIFNRQQIKRISVSGGCFIALSICSFVSDLFLSLLQSSENKLQYYFQLSNTIYIPIGIGLMIFSYVIQLATDMKEEQELVI